MSPLPRERSLSTSRAHQCLRVSGRVRHRNVGRRCECPLRQVWQHHHEMPREKWAAAAHSPGLTLHSGSQRNLGLSSRLFCLYVLCFLGSTLLPVFPPPKPLPSACRCLHGPTHPILPLPQSSAARALFLFAYELLQNSGPLNSTEQIVGK